MKIAVLSPDDLTKRMKACWPIYAKLIKEVDLGESTK